jgi:hypothetical protein
VAISKIQTLFPVLVNKIIVLKVKEAATGNDFSILVFDSS